MTERYRIRHIKSNKFRDINANDANHAIEISGWKRSDCEIKLHTNTGGGGWKKVKL
jgi:hypothetical protein